MSRLVIVPNALRDQINRRLDELIAAAPGAAADRDYFYIELLNYYDEHGVIPDFRLEAKA
jgi:hypothetical protein